MAYKIVERKTQKKVGGIYKCLATANIAKRKLNRKEGREKYIVEITTSRR